MLEANAMEPITTLYRDDKTKDSIILYCDILGYETMIEEFGDNGFFHKIDSFFRMMEQSIERINNIIKSTNKQFTPIDKILFSDNFVLLSEITDEQRIKRQVELIINEISNIITQVCLPQNLFIRGSITRGQVLFDPQHHFIYGTGLVKAHYLENNIACMPRIVVDEEIIKLKPEGITVDSSDGQYFIDYLDMSKKEREHYNKNCRTDDNPLHPFICRCQLANNNIKNNIIKFAHDEKVLKKYLWVAQYHNNFYKNNNDCIVNGKNVFIIDI